MDTALDRTSHRSAYVMLSLLLLAAIVLEVVKHGTGWWQAAGFWALPDLALLYGVAGGLAKGQLHPRAVPLYNLAHRFWLPAGLLVAATFVLPFGFFVGGLAWAFHIALDRALGYGLRTPDGFQRR